LWRSQKHVDREEGWDFGANTKERRILFRKEGFVFAGADCTPIDFVASLCSCGCLLVDVTAIDFDCDNKDNYGSCLSRETNERVLWK
jgi:hypothetical protein